ncbi:MAG: hypothetical protein Q8T13_00205 [Acidobacteriota bacterium]|nr:hypothetical protein [Acidobacteriota bacterium]
MYFELKSFARAWRLVVAVVALSAVAAPAGAQVGAPTLDPAAADKLRATLGGAWVERQFPLTLASGATCELRIWLQPDHTAHADRIADAAREAIDQYSAWFSPYPYDRLTIIDVPWQSPETTTAIAGVVPIRARWLQPERSLTLEAQVARGIARQWWGTLVVMPDRYLADGLVEYAQSRTLERIFDRRHQRLNYSLLETRWFGGLVPWAIRAARLDRQTTGINRPVFRRHPAVDLRDPSATARPMQMAKSAAAITTLERYLGWPALQRALSAAARRYAGQTMTAAMFFEILDNAADRDLSWFVDQAFGQSWIYDYAVADLTSVPDDTGSCGAGSCYRTTVVLQRLGEAVFAGTSLAPVGPFESGRALEIEVQFADGQHSEDHWDGRATEKTLVYHGPAPATAARIDPAGTLLLDANRLNNTRTLAPASLAASLPWAVRWTTWLQDLLLSSAVFF